MNQYFLMDVAISRAYHQKNPSLKRLIDIVLPGETIEEIMSDKESCTKINDAIDKYIKATFNKNTADLNLDEFVERYGNGKVDISSTTLFSQVVDIIHNNRDLLRKNINKGKYNPSKSANGNKAKGNENNGNKDTDYSDPSKVSDEQKARDKDLMDLIGALSEIYKNTDEYLKS